MGESESGCTSTVRRASRLGRTDHWDRGSIRGTFQNHLENGGVGVTKVGAGKSGRIGASVGGVTAYFAGALPGLLVTPSKLADAVFSTQCSATPNRCSGCPGRKRSSVPRMVRPRNRERARDVDELWVRDHPKLDPALSLLVGWAWGVVAESSFTWRLNRGYGIPMRCSRLCGAQRRSSKSIDAERRFCTRWWKAP